MIHNELDRLLSTLWSPSNPDLSGDVYALLDGARDSRIHTILLRSDIDCRCLYAGDLPRGLAEVAPYLVPLARGSPQTTRLLELAWGNAWGILVETKASISDLRRHLRRFLNACDERGKLLLFRYYDPRVLRVYLPTCDAAELHSLFGPIDRFVVEGKSPDAALEYRCRQSSLEVHATPLSETPGDLAEGDRNENAAAGSTHWTRIRNDRSGRDGVGPSAAKPSRYLTIRRQQMVALRQPLVEAFEREMVAHLRLSMPARFDERPASEILRVIRKGIEAGERLGIVVAHDVARLIEWMVRHGEEFWTEPEFSSSGRILESKEIESGRRLDLVAVEMFKRLAGP